MIRQRIAVLLVALLLVPWAGVHHAQGQDAAAPPAAAKDESPKGESPKTPDAKPAESDVDAMLRRQAEGNLKKARENLAKVTKELPFRLSLPDNPDELFGPKPKPKDNAFPLYVKSFAALGHLGSCDQCSDPEAHEALKQQFDALQATWGLHDSDEPPPAKRDVAVARKFLKGFADTLRHRDAAVKLAAYRSDAEWDAGIHGAVPDLNLAIALFRLTLLEAAVEMTDGQAELAYDRVAMLLAMAGHTEQEPTLVNCLLASSIRSLTYKMLSKMIHAAPPDAATETRLRSLLEYDVRKLLRQAFIVETNVLNVTFSDVVAGRMGIKGVRAEVDENGEWLHAGTLHPTLEAMYTTMQTAHLQYMHQVVRAAERPQVKAMEGFATLEAWLDKQWAKRSKRHAFAVMVAAGYTSHVKALYDAHAQGRMAQVVLALSRHRKVKGSYPAALSDLANATALPADPFTDTPLKYRRDNDGGGFTLWSVGPDGEDDGGRTTDELDEEELEKTPGVGDLVLRVPPVDAFVKK